jgi:hypothetical protein
MKWHAGTRSIRAAIAAVTAAAVSGCTAQGASPSTIGALESDKQALQRQLASMTPTMVVQAGQLAPAPPRPQSTGWDTPESIRGRLKLLATYDSSGPDAWDVRAQPLVYFTSEGVETRPLKSGVQVIDAYAKKVIASALFDMGEEVTENPHGVGISSDGRWLYLGQMQRVRATGQGRTVLLI